MTITAGNGSKDSATISIGRKYHTNIKVGVDDCKSDNPLWKVSPRGVINSGSVNVYLRYSWSNGFGSLSSGDVTLENGKYWLTVSNFVGGCITFDSLDLKPLEVTVSHEGDIVHALATGGIAPYKYQWSNGETTPSIQIQSGDLFTVTVTDALDCIREYNNRPKAPYVTIWDTSLPGSSDSNQIIIPGYGTNYSIHWEEVDHPENKDSAIGNNTTTLTFPNPGIYRVSITPGNGTFHRIEFSNTGDTSKILSIDQWGEIAWRSFAGAFKGCINLNSDAPDLPDLSNVSDMSEMFYNCIKLNGPSNIGQWDVSQVRDMRGMFRSEILFRNVYDEFLYYSSFNQEILNWSVANVTNMSRMFSGAGSFNQYIGNWNVSQVRNMEAMFFYAYSFNQNIGSWDVGNVTDMSSMFLSARSFNQEIGSWNVSNVTNMAEMFLCKPPWWTNAPCGVFNQNIGDWDVSNVTDMHAMFSTRNFNQNIENWDVSNVTDMSKMFSFSSFNQEIGDWNVSKVTNMSEMFQFARSFNQDIGSWNVSNVKDMSGMFYEANRFNQDIGKWDVSNVNNMSGMFGGWGFAFVNPYSFNANIGDWNVSNVTNMAQMFLRAQSFNQDLGNWNIGNVTDMREMFFGTGMECDNYSSTLIGWNKLTNVPIDINLGAYDIKYGTEAVLARDNLISEYGWIFTGDIPAGIECNMTVNTENSKLGYPINLNPNPFTNQLQVEYSGNENMTIILYDQLSRPVLQQTLYNSATIDTEHLPAGLYIYELKHEHGVVRSGKLVKM